MSLPMIPRRCSRSVLLAAAWTCLPVLTLALVPAAHAGKSAKASTTVSTSSGSTSTSVRTETRNDKKGRYNYSSVSDGRAADGPEEVDAYTFSRDQGHWRNTRGSEEDWEEAEAMLERENQDLFWFRRGSDRYIVTDRAALDELAEMFKPQEELGRRQGELGRLQGALGRKQGELGRIQARLGAKQAALSIRRAAFARSSEDEDPDLERLAGEVSRGQDEAGELQAELGEQQAALGERQAALGEQQAALGREQQRVSEQIERALGGFTRELIADGRAKRVDR
jgi:hypothetical protein